jgi:hypothetical protein
MKKPNDHLAGEIADVLRDYPVGDTVLAEVHAFLGRFVAYPSEHAHVAHTLWIAHAHLMECWYSTPRIALLSPEKGSGKTRALEVTAPLVPRPVHSVNATSAYLFRKVSDPDGAPTLLFDEIDTIFGPRSTRDHEDLRGMLNAGYRRGATAGRCVIRGKAIETEELPAYCAVALAGLGELPDTILSRAVVIRMRRRAPGEIVEPYRARIEEAEAERVRTALAGWCDSVRTAMDGAFPALPDGVADRDAEIWEPLLAVAVAAGGRWPGLARAAAVSMVAESKQTTPSLGVRLLGDVRAAFGDHSVMSTEAILTALHGMEEAPWSDLRGLPLNPSALAKLLRPYGVRSTKVRVDAVTTRQGYRRDDFHDAWERYLPSVPDVPPFVWESQEGLEGSEDSTNDVLSSSPIESGTNGTGGTQTAFDDYFDSWSQLAIRGDA